jgi:hypothetical protein
LAYLVVTNAVTLLRVLPMSDHDKDVEILALRDQTADPATAGQHAGVQPDGPRATCRPNPSAARPEASLAAVAGTAGDDAALAS